MILTSSNTFIIWKDGVTKDFELRLSFRCNATNNSGIQYRSKHITDKGVKFVIRGNHGMTHSAYISDPDGNGWSLEEVKTRLPGRV